MNDSQRFEHEKAAMIQALASDEALQRLARDFMRESGKYRYTYNFSWLGRPYIQFPQDMLAIQELIWSIKPRIIVESGIAHGGGLVFEASLLELLGGNREVIGVDIEIRQHNRAAIEAHPLARRIHMIEGSSTDSAIAAKVRERIAGRGPVMVILDSNHTHDHVLRELELYSPLVKTGSYLIVMDTTIEFLPDNYFPDRPWGKGNNPMTAVHAFLKQNNRFQIDPDIHAKLLITVAYDGYLKCVRD